MMGADDIIGIARRAKSLMHREELQWLIELARMAPEGVAVEIGVYLGSSLIALVLAREHLRGNIYGVDDWSYKDIDRLEIKCKQNLMAAGVSPGIISCKSSEAFTILKDVNPVSFLFIDGDHTRNFIEEDIKLWTPRLVRNGIVVFHDYGRFKNDCYVTQAVDAWQTRTAWIDLGCRVTTRGFRRP